jgi:hypothetical protein
LRYGAVRERDVVQVDPDQPGVVIACHHAVEGLLDGFPSALELRCGHDGEGPGIALAVGDGLQDVAGGLGPGQARDHGRQLDQGAFEEFLQPPPFAGAVADQLQPGAGQVPQRADLGRRRERRAQQARLREPGDPLRVQQAGLGPAGQLPGVRGVGQLHAQPGRLQQVVPDPPVVRRRLHDGQPDAVGEQPAGQRECLPCRRGDFLQPRRAAAAVAGRGQPGAHAG